MGCAIARQLGLLTFYAITAKAVAIYNLEERDKILLLVSFSWNTLWQVYSRACTPINYSYQGLSCGQDFLNKGLVTINDRSF
jgi:hypothetical protein